MIGLVVAVVVLAGFLQLGEGEAYAHRTVLDSEAKRAERIERGESPAVPPWVRR